MLDIPPYLARPPAPSAARPAVGTLTLAGENWVIEGDPQVCVFAKRLFPGSEGKGRGMAKFPATRRRFGDLVWLMQRYPLAVADEADFERAYGAAVQHTLDLAALKTTGGKAWPPAEFNGTLRPFQAEALHWALTSRRGLIADEMGLGKTVEALAVLAALDDWPVLIVVQPHLVEQWRKQIASFLGGIEAAALPLMPGKASGAGPALHVLKGYKPAALPPAQIYLCHYLMLAHWRTELVALDAKVVIFDEIQELRHKATEKYSAAHHIASRAETAFGLSGTPIYNSGGEIWNVLNIIEMHCLGDWDSFTREWCHGYGNDVVKDPALLGDYLRDEGLMIRRRKEDVLSELPAKRRIVEDVDADDGLLMRLSERAVELAVEAGEAGDPLERGRLEREALELARKATGIAKAPAVAQFVWGLMEAEEPTLVFAHHHAVVDHLLEALAKFDPVCITGRQNGLAKAEALRAFVAGETNLAIVSLRVAAGLDGFQERARVVAFAELDWSPAVHAQCEDRAHRMGQRDSVLAYYLVTQYGTDPDVMDRLGFKTAQFTGVMGDTPETDAERTLGAKAGKAHVKRILEKLRARGAKNG